MAHCASKVTKILCQVFLGIVLSLPLFEAQAENINIDTPILTEADLSKAGYTIKLHAMLRGTNDVKIPVRALVVLDGDMFLAYPEAASLNSENSPEYIFYIPAPESDLAYQFMAYPGNKVVFSEKNVISRTCLAPKNGTKVISEDLSTKDKLDALMKKATALDDEAGLYNEAKNIALRLEKIMKELLKQ